jgi:lysophospholipase L1-like esterase
MLGTNDLKLRFSPIPFDIAAGVQKVVSAIQDSRTGPGESSPRILMICPPPTVESEGFSHIFGNSVELSKQMTRHYKTLAEESGVLFFEAGKVISTSPADGIHLESAEHRKLAEAVADIIMKNS